MSIFVYDYDHNAPSAEHLAATHEPFFRIIRAAHPNLPVIIMSKPDFDYSPDQREAARHYPARPGSTRSPRRDNNVYFIDGQRARGARRGSDRHFWHLHLLLPPERPRLLPHG